MIPENDALIDRYVRWLETLSGQGTHRISQFVGKDVRYRTPALEAAGMESVGHLFRQRFEGNVQIITRVRERFWAQDGVTVYLKWEQLVTYPGGTRETLSGVSEIMFNNKGRIVSIIDYWDSVPQPPKGFLARLFQR